MDRRELLLGGAVGLGALGESNLAAAKPAGLDPGAAAGARGAGAAVRDRIVRDFPRPAPDVIARLKAGAIKHVGGPFGFQARYLADVAIKPVRPDMTVLGPAFTVRLHEPDLLLVSYAINLAKPGDVLVIDVGGQPQLSVFGYTMSQSCLNRGIAGVVVDGAVLDSEWLRGETPYAATEAQRRGLLPVWSRTLSPTWADWNKPGSINVPVQFGGLAVNPGDIVYGTRDGVFVVPQPVVPDLIASSERWFAFMKSRNWLPRAKAGETWFDILEMKSSLAALQIPEFDSLESVK